MIIERQAIQLHTDYAAIHLNQVADSKTMKIMWMGKELIPKAYNLYGYPIFPKEMYNRYTKADRVAKMANQDIRVEITYEKLNFTTPIEEFDSLKGIQKSLRSLSNFYQMLNRRKVWYACTQKDLNVFMIYGRYALDTFGQLYIYHPKNIEDISYFFPDVCSKNVGDMIWKETHMEVDLRVGCENGDFFGNWNGIQNEGEKCPYCGKKFTINDLKNCGVDYLCRKHIHRKCLEEHEKT